MRDQSVKPHWKCKVVVFTCCDLMETYNFVAYLILIDYFPLNSFGVRKSDTLRGPWYSLVPVAAFTFLESMNRELRKGIQIFLRFSLCLQRWVALISEVFISDMFAKISEYLRASGFFGATLILSVRLPTCSTLITTYVHILKIVWGNNQNEIVWREGLWTGGFPLVLKLLIVDSFGKRVCNSLLSSRLSCEALTKQALFVYILSYRTGVGSLSWQNWLGTCDEVQVGLVNGVKPELKH